MSSTLHQPRASLEQLEDRDKQRRRGILNPTRNGTCHTTLEPRPRALNTVEGRLPHKHTGIKVIPIR